MSEYLSPSQIYLQTTTTTITTLMPSSSSTKLLPERQFRSTPKGLSGMLSASSRKRFAEDQIEGRASRARLFEIPDSGSNSNSLLVQKDTQNVKPFSMSMNTQGGSARQELSLSDSVDDFPSVFQQSAPFESPSSSVSSIISKSARSITRPNPHLSTDSLTEDSIQHRGIHLAHRRAIQPPPPMTPVSNPRSSPRSYEIKKQGTNHLTQRSTPEFEDRYSLSGDKYMHSDGRGVQFGTAPFVVRRDHEGFPAGLFDEDDEDDMFMRIGTEDLLLSQDNKHRTIKETYTGNSVNEDTDLNERRHGFRGTARFDHLGEVVAQGQFEEDDDDGDDNIESTYRRRPVFSPDEHRSFNPVHTSSRSFDPITNREISQQAHGHDAEMETDPSLPLLGQLVLLKGGKLGEAYEKMKERYAQETLSTEQWETRGKDLGARFNTLTQKMAQHTQERAEIHRTAIEKLEAHDSVLSNRSSILEDIQRGLAGKASSLLERS